VKQIKLFKNYVRQLHKQLEHSETTRRVDIKRVLMRFKKEHMFGFKLEGPTLVSCVEGMAPELPSAEEMVQMAEQEPCDVAKLMERRPNFNYSINKDIQGALKELNEKYVPTFELKWESKLEHVETDLSYAVKAQKEEHNAKMASQKTAKEKVYREKQRLIEEDMKRRREAFERARAKVFHLHEQNKRAAAN